VKKLLTFDDVLIKPRFSKIKSRADVSLTGNFGGPCYALPVMSANMDTVTDEEMAMAMKAAGGVGCLHRFCTIEANVAMYKRAPGSAVSIGLGTKELDRAVALLSAGASIFVIDVAHGAQISVTEQANELRKLVGGGATIIVGNFATGDSVKTFLEYAPRVNAFKVGIGPGSACTTRIKTGVGVPQLSAILDVSDTLKKTPIKVIADGGMREPGDIAKALGAGASFVMLGGMLAGTHETPGKVFYPEGPGPQPPLKKYRGSASKESYDAQGKDAAYRTAEGESFTVPYKGSVKGVLQDIEGGLRSSFAYVGAKNMNEYHNMVEFIEITSATAVENGAHGKKQK
jgi:IMP dehydrogenase